MAYSSKQISGDKLKAYIHFKFGKVASFARAVDVESQTVYKWMKHGRIDPERLLRVVEKLGIPERELVSDDPAILITLDTVTYSNLRVAADEVGETVEEFSRRFLQRAFGEKGH